MPTRDELKRIAWDKRHALLRLKDQGMTISQIARNNAINLAYASEVILRAEQDRKAGRERP